MRERSREDLYKGWNMFAFTSNDIKGGGKVSAYS